MRNLARILRSLADRIDPQPVNELFWWYVPEPTVSANVTDVHWTISR